MVNKYAIRSRFICIATDPSQFPVSLGGSNFTGTVDQVRVYENVPR